MHYCHLKKCKNKQTVTNITKHINICTVWAECVFTWGYCKPQLSRVSLFEKSIYIFIWQLKQILLPYCPALFSRSRTSVRTCRTVHIVLKQRCLRNMYMYKVTYQSLIYWVFGIYLASAWHLYGNCLCQNVVFVQYSITWYYNTCIQQNKNLSLKWRLKWNGFDSLEHGIKTQVTLCSHLCTVHKHTPKKGSKDTAPYFLYSVEKCSSTRIITKEKTGEKKK